ncbi:hypothetical protein EUTSA_v10024735mg [Eutrema salsugineum]|uniref:DUF3444 domain-containing protein n=1 Tax=Eutrema salsugineum TaxID=72664 RepID=V4LUY9_EUTSA|nr:uncharacterized protein LOC18028851 [Eutrema salsugineum]ESQ54460.1 hypothetical protein EUTSA_v10024735mg [Eutrema salsugineum]
MVMEGDSDITGHKNEGTLKTLDQIEEKASSILKFSHQFDNMIDSLPLERKEERLRAVEMKEKEIGLLEESISGKLIVLEEKEMDFDLRQVIEANLMSLVFEKQSEEVAIQLDAQEKKLCLIHHSLKKKLGDMMSEFEAKKEEARRLFESILEELCELENAEKDFVLNQKVETERQKEESKQLKARKNELRSLEEAIKEKSAELIRKEANFELKQREEADKWREETELRSKALEIKEKTLEKRQKELELKQMELEERSKQQLIERESRKRSNLEFEPPMLMVESDVASLTRLAKKQKSQEADLACAPLGKPDPASKHISEANDGDTKGVVCIDKSDEDPKSLTCPDAKFNDFNKSMSSFAVDQVWALYDSTDDMPRKYAQIKRVFGWESELSLLVTLLEHVNTKKDEKSIRSACGRFEYGDTEIKTHLMFAHEMQHIKCGNDVIVNPRKGETWALFRDWNKSWNSHSDLHEPPYRYDFVEVISEFDDRIGIAVAYMGKVKGFVSVFYHAEQHGLSKIMIPPGEMQRFSHKVASVKLRGEEKEGVPAGSYELNPAATPSYDSVLEEVVDTEIQSKDCGKAPTVENPDGSTEDQPIIID